MKKISMEMKQFKEDTVYELPTVDGVPVTRGDPQMWYYVPSPWEKFKIWFHRKILGHTHYGENGVYVVTKVDNVATAFEITRNKVHDL